MSYLHLGHDYGTYVIDKNENTIRHSKNLRGMLDYARVSPAVKIETRNTPENTKCGLLRVTYANGCYSIADFCSYHIMIDWVRNRRSWRNASHVMHGENIGYLTKPGIIGGKS